MAYNGKLPGKDEVANLIIGALRKDKEDVVINAEIQAEIDQPSFKAAEQQIKKLTKTQKVDIDTSKAEQKIKNLMEPLREIEKEIKELETSGVDFNIAHNTIKRYEQLKTAVSEATKSISKNNQELREAQQIIRTTDGVISGLSMTVEKATKKRKSKQVKKTTEDIKTQTDAVKEQTDAMNVQEKVIDKTISSMKEQISVQEQQTKIIEAAARAQEKLNKAVEKQLKLTRKKADDGHAIPQTYTAVDGKYEIEKGTVGWNLYEIDSKGFYEFVTAYETLNDLRKDSTLIAAQEAAAQGKSSTKITEAQEKIVQELAILSGAYEEMSHRAGRTAKFAEQYGAMFKAVQGGALSATEAIAQLNVEIDRINDVKTPNIVVTKSKYYEIDEEAARRSKENRSFDDYVKGSATASYRAAVDALEKVVNEKKEKFPDKAEQLDELLDKYAKNLAAFINRDNQIGAQYPSVMISGAGNYNIKKHDRQMASWGKNYQYYDDHVLAIENKIKNMGSFGEVAIRGDEEEALEKLEARLEYMKYWHQVMVEVNKYYRKNKTIDGFVGVEPDELERIKKDLTTMQQLGMHDVPYPQYKLTNDNQNIKRIEGRIAELKRLKADGGKSDSLQEENEFYKMWTDKKDMRIRISFEMGKPEQEIIDMLRGKAFKWSPKNGAWQRQLTDNAIYDAKKLQESLREHYQINSQIEQQNISVPRLTSSYEGLADAVQKYTDSSKKLWEAYDSGKDFTKFADERNAAIEQISNFFPKSADGVDSTLLRDGYTMYLQSQEMSRTFANDGAESTLKSIEKDLGNVKIRIDRAKESLEEANKQMTKTAVLIGELHSKYGNKFGEIFDSVINSFGGLSTANAEDMYDDLIAKEKEYVAEIKQRAAAIGELTKIANKSFEGLASVDKFQNKITDLSQQIMDGKININSAKQSLTEFAETLTKTSDANENDELIYSYKDLYKELEKIVNLSKQLKPAYTDEYEEMLQLTNNIGYVNNKEEAIAEIKAWYTNVQRIKSSLKNGLSVYKNTDRDGYEYESDATEYALEKADKILRGYIISAVENFGYTLTEAMNDFPKKRMRYFVEDQINKYYDVDARNSEYSAGVETFNAPIKEQIDTITTGISNMATSIDNMDQVSSTLFELTTRAKDVSRYTLSTEANKIGSLIGIQTPYEEMRMNAKRIESYEELCKVVARYNELQGDAVIYGGKDQPGFDENVEMEYRELVQRLKLTAGEDVFRKFRFDTPKDIEKLANASGIKLSQSYETENGQFTFIEGAKESIVLENSLQEEIKETNELLEGQISIEEHLTSAAEQARKQLEQQQDISNIVSRDIIDKALQGIDVEGLLSNYGLQGDKLTHGVDLFKDLAGARYLGDNSPKEASNIFNELFEFISENAQHTEEVVKTLHDFRERMKLVQIRIPENMEQTFAAEFEDMWSDFKKLYAIGGNSKNKKKLLTTSKYDSTPDVLINELIDEGFGGAFDSRMMQNFNGSAQDSLRILLDAIQRAKEEFKLPNTQTIFGLDDDGQQDLSARLINATNVIEQNVANMQAAIKSASSSGDELTNSAERAADATERQASAERDLANAADDAADAKNRQNKSSENAVSVEEIIARDVNEALEKLRSAKNNETTLFSLNGVFEGEDLVTQAQEMVKNIAEQANLTLSSFNVKDDTIKVKLYNDELKVTVDQMYKLKAAAEDAESATLELTSQSFTQNVKALNENNFDTEGMQQRALASIEKVRSSLHGLEYDLTDLENAAKNISSHDDFTKFNNQLKAAQDNIQAIKNSTVSKNSMNPLANMQRDMQNANIEIETMRLKLEKFGDIQGVNDAKQMLTDMAEAARQYQDATDAQGQQAAYNQYSNLRSSFRAQTEYINAAKSLNDSQESAAKQVDPVREQYKSLLDIITKINTANSNILKYQEKDGGSGLFSGYIKQLQSDKSQLISQLQGITQEINRSLSDGFVQGTEYSLPFSKILSDDDWIAVSSFLNDTKTQASLTTEEIDKLVVSLQKAQTIDVEAAAKVAEQFKSVQETYKQIMSLGNLDKSNINYQAVAGMFADIMRYKDMLDTDPTKWTTDESANLQKLIDNFNKYGNILVQVGQKEEKYFADKARYTQDTTMSSMAEDAKKSVEQIDTAQQKLTNAAKLFAKESGSDAIITNFTKTADGISRLDFSVFDTATSSLRNFRMEMGSVTDGMYVTETTVSKSLVNIQAAQKQLQNISGLIGRLGASGINVGDGTAAAQVQKLLTLHQQLSAEINKGGKADQGVIAKLTKDSKLATSEVEKLYRQMLQMESAIESGQADGLGIGDPTGDIYGQLAEEAKKLAATHQGATLEFGRFDKATNTLNTSLVYANGTVESFKLQMNGLNGQMIAQQSGVNKLATSWDKLKADISSAGKQFMTAFAGYNVFFKAMSYIRTGIGYVKEIDLALTELKKVTDETEASYAKFLQTAADTAGQIGSTVSDFTEATANFARLGYTMSESADMAKTAVVYKNVADGLDTVEEATDSIISTMKAFGIESDNTIGIVDRFNEVGNNFAITSAGIGDALQRSASALFAAGNTIDESIALVTAANSVIQNPEQVGTALKTLSLRIRGVKTELEEAGLETEGMADTTAQLQKKLKALTHGKVDIMLDADTFKNTTQILREMSYVWEEMTDMEQAAALELIGGKRQANILASVITNFETVENVIKTSMDSAGSAMEENAKWLDSIEGKSTQLTNAMQALWNETINSDVIKFFLDLAIGATEVVDTIGVLPSILAAVGIYFAAFKKQNPATIFKDLGAHINNFNQAVAKVNAVKSLNIGTTDSDGIFDAQRVNAYAAAVSGLTTKQQALLLATEGLTSAQIQDVLIKNGVAEADARVAVAEAQVAATKTQVAAITGEQIFNLAAETGAKLSNEAVTWLSEHAEEEFTKTKLKSALASSTLSDENKKAILSLFGLSGAATGAGTAFKGLGAAIRMAFKSNPVGIILSIISVAATAIPFITNLSESTKEAAQNAVSASEELKSQSESLESYKKQLSELKATLADNTISEQEAYDAREKLLTIQDELAEKFGIEKTGIDSVTDSINTQIAAIDKLSQANAQRWLNDNQKAINQAIEFFDNPVGGNSLDSWVERLTDEDGQTTSGIINWGSTKNVSDMIEAYTQNKEHIGAQVGITGEQYITFSGSVEEVKSEVEEFQDWLAVKEKELNSELLGLTAIPEKEKTSDVKARIKSLTNDIEQIKHVREDIGVEATNWFGEDSAYAANKALLEQIQQNTLQTAYADQYANILTEQKKFADAQAKGDKEAANEALTNMNGMFDGLIASAPNNGHDYMVEFFQGMKDEYATQTKDMEISLDLSTEDGKNTLFDALSGFDGKNAKEILQAYEFNPDGSAFVKLKEMANSYDIEVEELINSLIRLGYVQGDFDSGTPETISATISSIDTLTSVVESYKAALEAVNNILFDGQAISEDYYNELKEQLSDITVCEEEFSDAIEEQNGKYIVKNVALLKKLVAQSKKARKATIEVARSQAQLQYRNIVNEMRNAVLVMGIEYDSYNLITDATLDNISAMREQIDALKQTIQQYALLEVSLSDAASAYDEYEAAKERDAQLSYDESFSEMLKTIDDGLLKNETGSEAFEYSVKAIVPEDIWSGIEDPNEKVKAIHDYIDGDSTFSKLFHVDEESGDLDINTDNVREFIKLSKEAGMIVGGPEGFELSDIVYGTKEWAEELGITEAAVLALLSATEDCDALWGNILTDVMTHPLDREINKSVDAVDEATKKLEDYLKLVQKTNSDEDKTNDVEFDSEYYNQLVSDIGAANDKLIENQQAALDNAQAYNTVQAAVSSFMGALTLTDDEATNLANSLKEIEGLEDIGEIVIEDGQLKLTDDQLTLILGKLGKITEPSVVQVQLRYDEISEEIDQINEYIKNNCTGRITIDGINFIGGQDKDGNSIESYLAKLTAEQKEIQLTYNITETSTEEEKSVLESYQEMAKNGVQFTVTAMVDDAKAGLDSVSDAQDKIKEKQTITFSTNASTIAKTIKDFADDYDRITSKVITLTVNVEKNETVTSADPTPSLYQYSGLKGQQRIFEAFGNARANGSNGLSTAEHDAIVGELGPELVCDPIKGIYYTVGNDGTEMVNLPKGAIIYNHKQTEELLRNGHTTRGNYTGGLSFAQGNAHSIDYGIPDYHPNLKDETSFNNGTDINTTWDDAASTLTSAASAISDALKDAADSVGEFEETIDWIEIRMEEYDELISKMSAELENLITASEKNAKIDEIIAKNKEKQADAEAGAKYYEEYAQKYLAGMNDDLIEAAKNGAIAINEFTKEQDEATVKAIQNYRDYAQKAADLYQQVEEITTEIADLAKQAFDNVVNEFENKISLNDSKIGRYEAHNDLLETDKGWASEDIYTEMQKENEAKIDILKQQRDAMQAELDTGKIKKGTDAWYEAVNAIAEVDTEIINLNTEIEDLQDSINELHWEKFDLLTTQLQAVSDEAENLLDILATKDAVDELGNWTDEGITSLGLLAQQMEVAEMQAAKYQEEIEYLEENWEALGYTQEEYIEKLEELKSGQYDAIKSYNDAKDAIVDLNKARVDAIKEGIEKEIDAYSELIEKKKEALDAEKDLHDFQKSVADQQKNIADIERQLAALSNDNSASARAKRAQLEAELAEAQAELQESYYDRSISDQQDALDAELDNFKEEKDAEIEAWEKYLENVEHVVADSLAMVQENTQVVYAMLTALAQQYGLNITTALTNPWLAGEAAIQNYGAKLNMSLTTLASMFGLTVDEFAAKLGLTTETLVSNLGITVAQMAEGLGVTNEQLAAKLGLTVTDLNTMMDLSIQELATKMGMTLPALAEQLGTTTAGLAGNLDMTMSQFAGSIGLTIEQLAEKFGLTAEDLACKLGMTYEELVDPFGLSMSATIDALKALEEEYKKILAEIQNESQKTVEDVNNAMNEYEEGQEKQEKQEKQDKQQEPTKDSNSQSTPNAKTEQDYYGVALAIWNGNYGWGTGQTRINNLKAKGFDANKVQQIVNQMGKDGYVHSGTWAGKYYGIRDLSPYHLNKFAKGSTGVRKDQLAIIDELGEELILRAQNGRLTYLEKGSGVVPADLTANLMEWGKLDPSIMLDNNRPRIDVSPEVSNTEIKLDCSVGTLLHIDEFNGENPEDIAKLVAKEFDKHTKNLNNALRRYAR